jgi:hypothetical protein
VDVGSGSGRAVLAAAALHGWKVAIGVELSAELHQSALANAVRWETGAGGGEDGASALRLAEGGADAALALCAAQPRPRSSFSAPTRSANLPMVTTAAFAPASTAQTQPQKLGH